MLLQNCLRVPRYPKISNFGFPVPEITRDAQPQEKKTGRKWKIDRQNSLVGFTYTD